MDLNTLALYVWGSIGVHMFGFLLVALVCTLPIWLYFYEWYKNIQMAKAKKEQKAQLLTECRVKHQQIKEANKMLY